MIDRWTLKVTYNFAGICFAAFPQRQLSSTNLVQPPAWPLSFGISWPQDTCPNICGRIWIRPSIAGGIFDTHKIWVLLLLGRTHILLWRLVAVAVYIACLFPFLSPRSSLGCSFKSKEKSLTGVFMIFPCFVCICVSILSFMGVLLVLAYEKCATGSVDWSCIALLLRGPEELSRDLSDL